MIIVYDEANDQLTIKLEKHIHEDKYVIRFTDHTFFAAGNFALNGEVLSYENVDEFFRDNHISVLDHTFTEYELFQIKEALFHFHHHQNTIKQKWQRFCEGKLADKKEHGIIFKSLGDE